MTSTPSDTHDRIEPASAATTPSSTNGSAMLYSSWRVAYFEDYVKASARLAHTRVLRADGC